MTGFNINHRVSTKRGEAHNTNTNAVVATVAVGTAPRYAVVTPDGSAVFVSNNSDGTVTRIATADNSTTSIPTGGWPRNMALSSDGSKVYVALQNSSIARIAVADNSVASIAFTDLTSTYAVTVVPGTTQGFVTDENGDQVGVFSTATDTENTGAGLPITGSFSTPRAITSLGAAPVTPTTTPTSSTPVSSVAPSPPGTVVATPRFTG
jgi:6-phosphogluconolactonase (cycloisomerase 2 family)